MLQAFTAHLYSELYPFGMEGRTLDNSYNINIGSKRTRTITPEPVVKFARIATKRRMQYPGDNHVNTIDARILYDNLNLAAARFAVKIVRIQRWWRRMLVGVLG